MKTGPCHGNEDCIDRFMRASVIPSFIKRYGLSWIQDTSIAVSAGPG